MLKLFVDGGTCQKTFVDQSTTSQALARKLDLFKTESAEVLKLFLDGGTCQKTFVDQ